MSLLSNYTKQMVCFISDKSPDENFFELRKNYPNLYYFECCLTDVEELSKTAIEDCFHVILLTWICNDSFINDSAILSISRIILDNFNDISFTMYIISHIF